LREKRPPITIAGRVLFPLRYDRLLDRVVQPRSGHKFMRLRATELAGSAVVGAAGAQVAGQLRGRLLGRRQTGHHVQSDPIKFE
jgi:hypothetical protein